MSDPETGVDSKRSLPPRHLLQGSVSLLEVALQLELYASELRRLHTVGWTLQEPVGLDGAASLARPSLPGCRDCDSPTACTTVCEEMYAVVYPIDEGRA